MRLGRMERGGGCCADCVRSRGKGGSGLVGIGVRRRESLSIFGGLGMNS